MVLVLEALGRAAGVFAFALLYAVCRRASSETAYRLFALGRGSQNLTSGVPNPAPCAMSMSGEPAACGMFGSNEIRN
jgi:hypothetical protein